jgi:hypothetical protein
MVKSFFKKETPKPAPIDKMPGLFAFESLERNVTIEKNIISIIFDEAKKKSENALLNVKPQK